MNCRSNPTPRTWGWGKTTLLGAAFALASSANAQISAYACGPFSAPYTPFALATAGPTGDDASTTVTLPFTFTYDGVGYTQMRFCTNGWISVNSASTSNSFTAGNFFTTTVPNGEIAVWHRDGNGNAANGGSLTSGPHPSLTDVYVFQFTDMASNGAGGTSATLEVDCQIWLYGPGSSNPTQIELRYGPAGAGISTGAAIGIENAAGTAYKNALNCSSASTATATAWPGDGNGFRFFDPPCDAPAGTASQTVDCGTLSYTLSGTLATLGDATSVDVVSSVHGTIATLGAPGAWGPTPSSGIGVNQTITLVHNLNPICNANLGSFSGTGVLCNDACANAITLGAACAGSPVSGTTTGATVDAIYTNCGAGGTNTTERGVWYRYVGDDNQVTITTCDPGGIGYDTRLTVYSGSCGAFTCVASNDDMTPACLTGSFRSRVQFNALTGTDYYVFVHGFQSGTGLSAVGNFNLSLSCSALCLPVPGNDVCAGATALTVDAPATSGTNQCASATAGNPSCESAFATLPDVYYSFVASAGGTNLVTVTLGTATSVGYAIYDACGGTQVACNANITSGTPTTHTGLIGGNTYFIRLESDELTTGTFDIQVTAPCQPAATATPVADCANQQFFIDVNVSSLGTSTDLDITTDFAGDTEPVGVGLGTTQIGPYPSGTTVVVTLVHDNGGVCNLTLAGASFTCPPANDACANAIPINCNSITSGTTVGSAIDAVPTCITGLNTAGGVWYTVVGSGGSMTASLCGAPYDSKIGIFTTLDCATFACITGEDDDFTNCGGDDPFVTWASTAGQTYHILVTGFSTQTGTFSLEVVCGGNNVPPCADNGVSVQVRTDDFGSETSWEIVPLGNTIPVCSGSGFSDNQQISTSCCLVSDCYQLFVFDSFGDGISLSTPAGEGGYRLFDANGERIIDNWKDGDDFTFTSSVSLGFCVPIGADKVIDTQCDRENWLATDVIIASANPLVSAQWGIGNQSDDGYQFWFFNPDGGYSRRILRTHATSGGQGPANAVRATKLGLGTIVTNPLPVGQLLNVRVRALENGSYSEFGPACRFKVDPAACTITQLNDVPSSPNYSCGVTGKVVGGSGNASKVFANVVTSGGNPATNYRFEFSVIGEGYQRNVSSNTAVVVLGQWATNPLLCGTYTYDVRVQASFDGGATYCPFGPVCTVEITNNQPVPFCTTTNAGMAQQADGINDLDGGDITMYPNPNNGDQLFMTMNGFDTRVGIVTLEIFDGVGKRAMTATLPMQDGMLNTAIALTPDMSAGLYMVHVTAGDVTKTERLVIQR